MADTGFMNVTADGWSDLNFDNEASVIVGVMFIACSFRTVVIEKFSENIVKQVQQAKLCTGQAFL